MRLTRFTAGMAPLLVGGLVALAFGCATSTVDQPANFKNAPQIVAVYAVDSVGQGANLPDVLMYSTDPKDAGRTSPQPPPSYGSFRIEFDQPLQGSSIANPNDRQDAAGSKNPASGLQPLSFCSPLSAGGAQAVQIMDVATTPATPIATSVCYDSSSALGQHPKVVVVPGFNSPFSTTAQPFTCQVFKAEDGSNDPTPAGSNVFFASHAYGLRIVTSAIKNQAGLTLAAPLIVGSTTPTNPGWVAVSGAGVPAGTVQYQFSTTDFEVMAVGYQDQSTGFFFWLDKPFKGFEKDLDPCGTTNVAFPPSCGIPTPTPGAAYQHPTDKTPLIIVMTSAPDGTAGTVTLTRADGTNPDSTAGAGGKIVGDGRVIEVNTGDTFEPNVTYKVTIPPTLTGAGGTVIPAAQAKSYQFIAANAALKVLSTTPAAGALAQLIGTGVTVEFQAPINPSFITAGTNCVGSGPCIRLVTGTDATGTPVPASTPTVVPRSNNQRVGFKPSSNLTPFTPYTISVANVPGGAATPPGFVFPSFTATFTTATFRTDAITVGGTSIDRVLNAPPDSLTGGNLTLRFNGTPVGVNSNSVQVFEVDPVTNQPRGTPIPITVTPVGGRPNQFTVQANAPYQPKFGQKYQVKVLTTITDQASGQNLRAEGCTAPDPTQCVDVRSFATATLAARVSLTGPGGLPTGFRVTFNQNITAQSANQNSASGFKLFPVIRPSLDPTTWSLDPNTLPVSCTQLTADSNTINCSITGSLALNTGYLLSIVFNQATPAVVSPSFSTDPSGRSFGNLRLPFTTKCP